MSATNYNMKWSHKSHFCPYLGWYLNQETQGNIHLVLNDLLVWRPRSPLRDSFLTPVTYGAVIKRNCVPREQEADRSSRNLLLPSKDCVTFTLPTGFPERRAIKCKYSLHFNWSHKHLLHPVYNLLWIIILWLSVYSLIFFFALAGLTYENDNVH